MKRYLVTGTTGGLGGALEAALLETDGFPIVSSLDRADLSGTLYSITDLVTKLSGLPLDGVVHCAGQEVISALRMASDEGYRAAMFAADSSFAILRACAKKGVLNPGASIVLVSSVAAHRGTAGMAAYSAGKAAVEAMARSAAVELAPRKVRVNCVAAGAFCTPMHDRIIKFMPDVTKHAYEQAHPLGFGTCDDVLDAILFLLSDAARWVTGTTVVVDGGFLAR